MDPILCENTYRYGLEQPDTLEQRAWRRVKRHVRYVMDFHPQNLMGGTSYQPKIID